jgi:hypothetical protein
MATSEEKFRKLLAAYEDEVQRKQHKMSKKVDPRDQAEPNFISGYCPFLRGGQQVVWAPSFDVIGTFEPSSGSWYWGWAEESLSPKVRTRVEAVRKQGAQWGIDLLVNDPLMLTGEDQAWELSVVSVAVASADALYRWVDGAQIRFLALYDAPAPSRSSASQMPAAGRSSSTPSSAPSAPPAAGLRTTRSGSQPSFPALTPTPPPVVPIITEPEPSSATRAELGTALYQSVPPNQLGWLGAVALVARVTPPAGPLGPAQIELRVTLLASNGAQLTLAPTPALHDAVVGAWQRGRDRGAPFSGLVARLELTAQGWITTVELA